MARLKTIEAEIAVPPVVVLPRRGKTVKIDARVTLRNTGAQDVVVHARSEDDRHFWHVFDSNHREVLRERRTAPGRGRTEQEKGVHTTRTETVAAGHEVHASRRLRVDLAKLKAGEVYTVRAEYCAHVAEARFSVVAPPTLAKLKPAKKKPAKRKPAKKKPAKRKPAKKKPAKRTATKRKTAR